MRINSITVAVFMMVILIIPKSSYANLGDSLSKAKSRTEYYKKKYGAIDPLFETDDNGKVIWECWAAPPKQWTGKEALKFAMELVPKPLKKETPKKGKKDGTYYPYKFSDGTMIILSGFNGAYFGLEVRAPGFKGPRC